MYMKKRSILIFLVAFLLIVSFLGGRSLFRHRTAFPLDIAYDGETGELSFSLPKGYEFTVLDIPQEVFKEPSFDGESNRVTVSLESIPLQGFDYLTLGFKGRPLFQTKEFWVKVLVKKYEEDHLFIAADRSTGGSLTNHFKPTDSWHMDLASVGRR